MSCANLGTRVTASSALVYSVYPRTFCIRHTLRGPTTFFLTLHSFGIPRSQGEDSAKCCLLVSEDSNFASHFLTANSVVFYTQRELQKLNLDILHPPKVLLFYDPVSSPIHKYESGHNFVHFLVLISSVTYSDAKVALHP